MWAKFQKNLSLVKSTGKSASKETKHSRNQLPRNYAWNEHSMREKKLNKRKKSTDLRNLMLTLFIFKEKKKEQVVFRICLQQKQNS